MTLTPPVLFTSDFLNPTEADGIYTSLFSELELRAEQVYLYDQWRTLSRHIDFRGDPGLSYRYSGVTKIAKPWTPTLLMLRDKIACTINEIPNAVLANYYPDGHSSLGWHTDAEPDLDATKSIISLSFGESRDFQVRPIQRTSTDKNTTYTLSHGSLVIMPPGMQDSWEHCVPKRTRVTQGRLNLTFRTMLR